MAEEKNCLGEPELSSLREAQRRSNPDGVAKKSWIASLCWQ
jgi:hypothetical protein